MNARSTDAMLASSKDRAKAEAEASVADLTRQIEKLTAAREDAATALADLRSKLDEALDAASGTTTAAGGHATSDVA